MVSETELETFLAAARSKTQLDLGYETGKKYARVFEQHVNAYADDRRIFCFIDLTNGNVLRPENWKRPNLNVKNSIQGNIHDDQKGCGVMIAGGRRWSRSAA